MRDLTMREVFERLRAALIRRDGLGRRKGQRRRVYVLLVRFLSMIPPSHCAGSGLCHVREVCGLFQSNS